MKGETFKFNTIYVIESLCDKDRKTGSELYNILRWKNDILNRKFNSDDFKSHLHSINNKDDFFNCLSHIENSCLSDNDLPIIHFEIHGNENGLVLKNDDSVAWNELNLKLTALNIITKNNLFITFAVCNAAYYKQVIYKNLPNYRSPFYGMLSSPENLSPNDIGIRFESFYDTLLTPSDNLTPSSNLEEIFNRMIRSNEEVPNTLELTFSEDIFNEVYHKHIEQISTLDPVKRHNDLVTRYNVDSYPNHSEEKIKREFIKNSKESFEKIKNKFFMIDLYPENSQRFNVDWSDFKYE